MFTAKFRKHHVNHRRGFRHWHLGEMLLKNCEMVYSGAPLMAFMKKD